MSGDPAPGSETAHEAAAAWVALDAEIARWRAAGRVATFWWRDDDAIAATAALDRLLALAAGSGLPLSLAVIPAGADARLASRLDAAAADGAVTRVLQHGYAHENHEPPGARAAEVGPARPAETVLSELAAGRARLATLFGGRFHPVLVPPWNRIAPALLPRLGEIGLLAVSTWGPRPVAAARRWAQLGTHADPIRWRAGRVFAGVARCLSQVTTHLAARRTGTADAGEATGILTHHLAHDAAGWAFLEEALPRLVATPGVQFLTVDAALDQP